MVAYFMCGPSCPRCGHDLREAFEEILDDDPIVRSEEVEARKDDHIEELQEDLNESQARYQASIERIAEIRKEAETKQHEYRLSIRWAAQLLDGQQTIPPNSEKAEWEWERMKPTQRIRGWVKALIDLGKTDGESESQEETE